MLKENKMKYIREIMRSKGSKNLGLHIKQINIDKLELFANKHYLTKTEALNYAISLLDIKGE